MPTIPESLALAEQAISAGDLARAQFIYDRILQAVPNEPHALNGLGVVAFRGGRVDEAAALHERAIREFPGNPAFHNNLQLAYARQGRLSDAIACTRASLELAPDSAELHSNLGSLLNKAGQREQAAESFHRAITLSPDSAAAHYNLANTLADLHRLDESEAEYRRALQLDPRDAATHNNLGSLLQLRGNFSEAIACFRTALGYQPRFAEAHRNRALLRLLLGDYQQGWTEYEWRFRLMNVPPAFTQPRWEGQLAAGQTILLWAEQGLGDTIQFARFAAEVKQRSAARVILQCSAALHPILHTAAGIDELVDETHATPFDLQIPLLSTPAVLGTTLDTIPRAAAYISAEPARIGHWREVLGAHSGLKVGIAWQGNPRFAGDYHRSIPLSALAPLAAVPGVQLFSIQKGPGVQQLAPLAASLRVVDLGPSLDEIGGAFLDTAAVMKNLDLVITSDTAVAHLAGALGVPVWVALQLSPNWRWLLDRDDSPWYPTMRLFRQSRFGEWQEVFQRISAALRSLSSQQGVG